MPLYNYANRQYTKYMKRMFYLVMYNVSISLHIFKFETVIEIHTKQQVIEKPMQTSYSTVSHACSSSSSSSRMHEF